MFSGGTRMPCRAIRRTPYVNMSHSDYMSTRDILSRLSGCFGRKLDISGRVASKRPMKFRIPSLRGLSGTCSFAARDTDFDCAGRGVVPKRVLLLRERHCGRLRGLGLGARKRGRLHQLAAGHAVFDVHAIVKEVPLGSVQFHPELADACVAVMGAVSCADWGRAIDGIGALSPYAPCQGLAQGMIADDGACTGQFDCVSGECSIGTCVTLGSLGASCDGSCKAGLRCIGTPFTCQPKVEAALLKCGS
jgi:hypothetical protein